MVIKKIFSIILVLFYLGMTGCSMPSAALERSLYSFTKEEKKIKGAFGKKKFISIKDFRGNDVYEEDIIDLKEEIEKYISSHPDLSESAKNNLRELRVTEGATREEVRLLLGAPDKIIRASSAKKGTSEIWIYKLNKMNAFTIFIVPVFFIHQAYYLYFQDNSLFNIERHYLRQIVEQSPGPGIVGKTTPETNAK